MKLIMNADDLGLTEKVNFAIVECFKVGIVKSTTLMVNQPATDHAVSLIKKGLLNDVGLHLTLTSGKPVLAVDKVSSLVDDRGYFLSKEKLAENEFIDIKQVEAEFQAQYDKAIEYGVAINHLDSHHFAGTYSVTKQAFINFANKVNLPTRRVDHTVENQIGLTVNTPDVFDMSFYDQGVTLAQLKSLLMSYQDGNKNKVVELMCHVGFENDKLLDTLSSYSSKRKDELDILTNDDLVIWLKQKNIQPIGYSQFF